MKYRLAAIDMGSNAIRLIIGEVDGHHLSVVKKIRAPVRLGKTVFKEGRISQEAQNDAIKTFAEFAKVNRKYKVIACRAVATSAVREAQNGAEFVATVRKKTGINIEIIDGIEEARLIHLAVQREVDLSKKRILLLDIGGGSVEVTFSENGMMSATQSFPMGTVRVLQMLASRKLNEQSLRVVMGEFLNPLQSFIASHAGSHSIEWVVGTGGNLECMGRLKLQLLKRRPHTLVSLQELVKMTTIVEELTMKERIEKLGLRPDRADVILPAMILTKTILRQSGVQKLLIPGVGLRNGLLWSLAEQNAPNPQGQSYPHPGPSSQR